MRAALRAVPSRLARLARVAGTLAAVAVCVSSGGRIGARSPSDTDRSQARPAGTASPSDASRPPNIVLILTDDLGYGDLSCYGHPTIRTPRLDRFASEATRFTSYYSGSPLCTPARAALMTGRYAIRDGVPAVLGPDATHGLAASTPTLAERLRGRGYRTHAIGKWHLGHASAAMLPTGRGFDGWLGLPYSNDMIPPWVQTARPLRLYRDAQPLNEPVDQDALTGRYTEEAVAFIERASADPARPFFLYLAHSMPHLPLHAPAQLRGRSRAGLYGDVIEMLDRSTGDVLDALAKAGVADRTIVIFTSDNGPWSNMPDRMLQQGIQRWDAGSSGPFRDAKGTTYEGGIRVPAIVRWPGRIQAGQTWDGIATAMDLHATLVRAAGGDVPRDIAFDGDDLLPLLARPAPAAPAAPQSSTPAPSAAAAETSKPREFFYFNNTTLQGVRIGPWKLRRAKPDAPPELFNLEIDPSERYDRARDEPAIVERLDARLRAFAATLPVNERF